MGHSFNILGLRVGVTYKWKLFFINNSLSNYYLDFTLIYNKINKYLVYLFCDRYYEKLYSYGFIFDRLLINKKYDKIDIKIFIYNKSYNLLYSLLFRKLKFKFGQKLKYRRAQYDRFSEIYMLGRIGNDKEARYSYYDRLSIFFEYYKFKNTFSLIKFDKFQKLFLFEDSDLRSQKLNFYNNLFYFFAAFRRKNKFNLSFYKILSNFNFFYLRNAVKLNFFPFFKNLSSYDYLLRKFDLNLSFVYPLDKENNELIENRLNYVKTKLFKEKKLKRSFFQYGVLNSYFLTNKKIKKIVSSRKKNRRKRFSIWSFCSIFVKSIVRSVFVNFLFKPKVLDKSLKILESIYNKFEIISLKTRKLYKKLNEKVSNTFYFFSSKPFNSERILGLTENVDYVHIDNLDLINNRFGSLFCGILNQEPVLIFSLSITDEDIFDPYLDNILFNLYDNYCFLEEFKRQTILQIKTVKHVFNLKFFYFLVYLFVYMKFSKKKYRYKKILKKKLKKNRMKLSSKKLKKKLNKKAKKKKRRKKKLMVKRRKKPIRKKGKRKGLRMFFRIFLMNFIRNYLVSVKETNNKYILYSLTKNVYSLYKYYPLKKISVIKPLVFYERYMKSGKLLFLLYKLFYNWFKYKWVNLLVRLVYKNAIYSYEEFFKKKLVFFLQKSYNINFLLKNIKLSILPVANRTINLNILLSYWEWKFRRNFSFYSIVKSFLYKNFYRNKRRAVHNKFIKGFFFKIAGRYNRRQRASFMQIKRGRVAFHNLRRRLSGIRKLLITNYGVSTMSFFVTLKMYKRKYFSLMKRRSLTMRYVFVKKLRRLRKKKLRIYTKRIKKSVALNINEFVKRIHIKGKRKFKKKSLEYKL